MTDKPHRTATVPSADVTLFYRRFGAPDATPILILHGANYYDSADWIDVAEALANNREVAAYDARGYGRSTRSPSKDYSNDAQLGDALAVLDDLDWEKAVIMGASRGGAFGLAFASHFPARTAAFIAVDYFPDIGIRHPGTRIIREQSIGNAPRVYPTIEAACSAMSRDRHAPLGSVARRRLEEILAPVDGGYIIALRDPDFLNPIPTSPAQWPTNLPPDIDLWGELAKIEAPVMFIKALRSEAGHAPDSIERLRRDFPQVACTMVDGGHDVAASAPGELVQRIRAFLDRTGL